MAKTETSKTYWVSEQLFGGDQCANSNYFGFPTILPLFSFISFYCSISFSLKSKTYWIMDMIFSWIGNFKQCSQNIFDQAKCPAWVEILSVTSGRPRMGLWEIQWGEYLGVPGGQSDGLTQRKGRGTDFITKWQPLCKRGLVFKLHQIYRKMAIA